MANSKKAMFMAAAMFGILGVAGPMCSAAAGMGYGILQVNKAEKRADDENAARRSAEKENEALRRKLDSTQVAVFRLTTDKKNLEDTYNALKVEDDDRKQTLQENLGVLDKVQLENQSLHSENQSLRQQIVSLEKENRALQSAAGQDKAKIAQLQSQVNSLQNQIETLKGQVANAELAARTSQEDKAQAESELRGTAMKLGLQSRELGGIAYEALVSEVQLKECAPKYWNSKEASCFRDVSAKLHAYRGDIERCVTGGFSQPYFLEGKTGSNSALQFEHGVVVLCDQSLRDR